MKKGLKLTLIFSSLSLVLLFSSNYVYAKNDSEDIKSNIDYFFEKRTDITTRKLDLANDNANESKLNNINKADERLLNKVNIRDEKLEEYFIDYLKLYDVIYSKANLKEDIINEDIDKDIKYEGDKIIVDVVRTKDSIFTIDGVKSDDISTEVARYTFVFDANTHELLDFIPESNEERVLMDSNMKDVIQREILNRENEEINSSDSLIKINDNLNVPTRAYKEYSFNRSNMVNYANRYAYSRNPNYGDFSNLGGDCTNFVSQIIKAGNAPFDTTGSYTWYYYNMNNRSSSWTGVGYLYNYLTHNDYIGPQGKLANTNEILYGMRPGDPVFIDLDSNGTLDHAVSITSYQQGSSNSTKVAAHTTDRKNYPLSFYPGTKKYVKLTVYGR